MNSLLLTLGMTCLVTLAWSHLCLISPPQRGSMEGLNEPGSLDCLKTSPCGGGDVSSDAIIMLKRGQRFVLTFQKNQDHTLNNNTGFFLVRMFTAGKPENEIQILELQDGNQNDLHLYTEDITIPSNMTGHAVLQVQYHSLNPDRGPVFYQCADLEILP